MKVLLEQPRSDGGFCSLVSEDGGMAFIKAFVMKLVDSQLNKDVQFIEVKGSELTRWDEPNADIFWGKDRKIQKKDIEELFESNKVDEPDMVSISGKFNDKKYNIECRTKWMPEDNTSGAVNIKIRPADKELVKEILCEIGYSIQQSDVRR